MADMQAGTAFISIKFEKLNFCLPIAVRKEGFAVSGFFMNKVNNQLITEKIAATKINTSKPKEFKIYKPKAGPSTMERLIAKP